jgi:transcriptional regulator with XRE-family HTH domain
MEQLGERLRDALRNAGMTQRELARTLDLSEQSVGNWIGNRSKPSAANLDTITGLLGVDRGWLLTGVRRLDESSVLEELRQIRATQDEILAAVQEVRRLQAKQRAAVSSASRPL